MKSGSGCICFIALIAEEIKKRANVLLLETLIETFTIYSRNTSQSVLVECVFMTVDMIYLENTSEATS